MQEYTKYNNATEFHIRNIVSRFYGVSFPIVYYSFLYLSCFINFINMRTLYYIQAM